MTERPIAGRPSLRVTIQVKPGARVDRAGGIHNDDSLLVRVRAPAVDGRANDAARRVLADAFDLPQRQVRVVQGHRARTKVVELVGDPATLGLRLAELLADPEAPSD